VWGPIVQLGPAARRRQLLLFEGEDEFGRLKPQLGTTALGGLAWGAPITEDPGLDDVEIWEIHNSTEDAHPIHLHLVAFQVLNRQKFKADQDENSGALTGIRYVGNPRPPEPNEAGWKDTVQMFPGEVTRVIARFDRPGEYVWHCHILSHEDHEMMRPYVVG
jgi:spore coat protein A